MVAGLPLGEHINVQVLLDMEHEVALEFIRLRVLRVQLFKRFLGS
jgi:hypothetical protein